MSSDKKGAAAGSGEAGRNPAKIPQARAARPKEILVIDDSGDTRSLLKLHLSNAGYVVRLAEDAIVGGHAVLQHKPDLMIVDVDMPHMNGFELVDSIAADPEIGSIPIIFLTALEDAEDRARSRGAGFLRKPITVGELLAAVADRLAP
ncbi:MAG TPA: response regulator [Burkholderiales bacterium]|jgi:CheY-like chemotaxis protein|nr:response regulator [Burkholderiales bacterium]